MPRELSPSAVLAILLAILLSQNKIWGQPDLIAPDQPETRFFQQSLTQNRSHPPDESTGREYTPNSGNPVPQFSNFNNAITQSASLQDASSFDLFSSPNHVPALLDESDPYATTETLNSSSGALTLEASPGEGISISMVDGTSRLKLKTVLSLLMIASTKRPFSSGLPLLLVPDTPFGEETNTFDLHARQSTILAQYTGPEFCGLTPGGVIYTLFLNDNLTSDNYGLLLYYAYGELKNERWRFAAGLQEDIFSPPGPNVLPVSLLYGSGNPGSYRGQIRFERFLNYSDALRVTLQGGLSEPVATIIRGRTTDPLVEDNGWPNVEGRLAIGIGMEQELLGGRTQRPMEIGFSGVVGQLRTTRFVGVPPAATRITADIWAIGSDLQCAFGPRWGMLAEFFAGQTIADYNAGILQNFNSNDFRPIRSVGGYMELYCYLSPIFHAHCGYGIDDAHDGDLAAGQATSNQTFFTTLLYDMSKSFQVGLEVDYRKTNYLSPAIDSQGFLFMSQAMWRF